MRALLGKKPVKVVLVRDEPIPGMRQRLRRETPSLMIPNARVLSARYVA